MRGRHDGCCSRLNGERRCLVTTPPLPRAARTWTVGDRQLANLRGPPRPKPKPKSSALPPTLARWEIGQPNNIVASRTQLPLRLAWGMTVHAAQGLTIDRLQVDLGRVFADGQAHLAPSHYLLPTTVLTTSCSLTTASY